MSLLSTASVWSNEEAPKKRIPTMRKTVRATGTKPSMFSSSPSASSMNDTETDIGKENYQNLEPTSIEENASYQEDRNQKVNALLHKITSSSTEEDNKKMGDFIPISPPEITTLKGNDPNPTWRGPPSKGVFLTNDPQGSPNMSNYNQVYQPPSQLPQPYYSKMGIGRGGGGNHNNDKHIEKLNYIIHLLEEQQYEKTEHITEEFILYSFLGVFMIYIVDAFSRGTGKYVR